MLGSWYAYAAASHPDDVPYDLSFWRAEASTVGCALSLWLIKRRSPAALPVAAATAAATIALGALNKKHTGAYVKRSWPKKSFREKVFNRAMPALHAFESVALAGLGAAVAHKARTRGIAPAQDALIQTPWYPRARKLGLYFMSFSFLGHWGEMLFCTGIKYGIFKGGYDRANKMLWDQWLFPFPAEGAAAVLADTLLVPTKQAIETAVAGFISAKTLPSRLATPVSFALSFLANQLVCTSIDFTTGMVANRHYELWDYRDMRFHFMGQICLQNSLFYSVVATWGVWWLLPTLEAFLAKCTDTQLDGALVGLGSFFGFLQALYHILPPTDSSHMHKQ